ncbi:cGMP-dependent protein kinase [Aureococcus anophagefferens]|nr:cGMP-dependent protein kinase [Aureococcus anophagefferens]
MLRENSPKGPQYVIKTHGVHRTGILKDVAGILAEAGVSIAATQKVALGTEYAMVLHAFHPDGEGHAEAISDEASLQAYLGLGPVERRLVIECPQRPGLIMAVTQLLGVEGCKIPKMETFTSVRDGVVMFHMEAAVHVPRGHDMDAADVEAPASRPRTRPELTFDVDKNAITKQGRRGRPKPPRPERRPRTRRTTSRAARIALRPDSESIARRAWSSNVDALLVPRAMEGFNFGSSYNAAYAPTPKRKQRDDDVDMIPAKRAHPGVSSLTPLMRGAGLRSPGLSPGQRNAFDALKCPAALALTRRQRGTTTSASRGDSINFGNYTKKVVAKTDAVKKLIRQAMTPRRRRSLDSFEAVKYGKGTTIIKQGDRGDDFFVMEMGTVEFYIEGNKKAVGACGSGKGFGELALMYNTPRAATVLAKTDIIAWKIDREAVPPRAREPREARSEQYKALLMEIELNKKKAPETADGKSAFLRECITDDQLTKLADCMDEEDVDDGVDIIKEGEDGHTFYIIANGEVEGSATKVLAVDREDFVALLGSIEELIKNGSNKEEAVDTPKRKAERLGMEQITVIKTLGHGAFGRVKLDHVLMEREILMQLDHPFILKLICAFQDDYFIYFLLELLIGGELFTFLRKHQRFSEPTMKIYAAGVVLGFEHMHSKKIAYRDLKPENLVLDKAAT